MAHRSNQAVASQEQPALQPPDDPPPPRRLLIGWTTALLAFGVSTAALGLAIWWLRFPIASFFIGAALADRGAEADFQIVNLDFDHVVLGNIRFGSETAPDATAPRLEARWAWSGLTPRLAAVEVAEPTLRLRIDPAGRVSAGTLDRLGGGAPGRRRPSLPAIDLTITGGEATIEAPFGALAGSFEGAGTLGRDFSGVAEIAETSRAGDAHSLDRGSAELIVVSRDDAIAARLTANVRGLVWDAATMEGGQFRATIRAPLDLSRYEGEAAWRAERLQTPQLNAVRFNGGISAEAVARDNSLNPIAWQVFHRTGLTLFR
jgi:hypothetical protein